MNVIRCSDVSLAVYGVLNVYMNATNVGYKGMSLAVLVQCFWDKSSTIMKNSGVAFHPSKAYLLIVIYIAERKVNARRDEALEYSHCTVALSTVKGSDKPQYEFISSRMYLLESRTVTSCEIHDIVKIFIKTAEMGWCVNRDRCT